MSALFVSIIITVIPVLYVFLAQVHTDGHFNTKINHEQCTATYT
jgi:hypothetical protein